MNIMIKKLLPLFFVVLAPLVLTPLAMAQTFNDASNVVRSDLRTQKAALMTQAMRMNVEQSEAFWPIYREYDNKVDELIAQRLKLIQRYAGNYEIMTDDKAATLAKDAFKIAKERQSLREKTYKRMARSKALGPLIAVRFAQVDRQVNTLLDMEMMRMVPLIATPEELGLVPLLEE